LTGREKFAAFFSFGDTGSPTGTTKCATPYNVYLMFPQTYCPYCPTIFDGASMPPE